MSGGNVVVRKRHVLLSVCIAICIAVVCVVVILMFTRGAVIARERVACSGHIVDIAVINTKDGVYAEMSWPHTNGRSSSSLVSDTYNRSESVSISVDASNCEVTIVVGSRSLRRSLIP